MFKLSNELGSPSMIEFMRCVHVDGLSAEELRLLGAQGHLIAVALDGEFRASRQPACEHVYAAAKCVYDLTDDFILAVKTANHDDIEDSRGIVTFEVLRDRLNEDIALTVAALSKPESPHLSSDECLAKLVEQIEARAQADWHAPFAKAGDSWHNNITADDFILLSQNADELEAGKRRRRRCFDKTRQFYLPMFSRCARFIPSEHRDAYDRVVSEIDQISAHGLSSPEPPSQFDLFSDSQVAIPTRA